MLRDITIGQYYPADSKIHSLDPRVKLLATLVYIISLFMVDDVFSLLFISVALAAVIVTSKVPFTYIMRGLHSIIILLIFAAAFNIFLTPGIPIFTIWKLNVTKEGIKSAAVMMIRMIYLIAGTSLMTLTTTPNALTDGLEKSLSPLNKINVPVHEIAMMMSIALRFIPILIEETDKIMKAQMARGADFESGSIIKKAKNMVPLLVPLFVSAFRRANDLAMAMEARCYHGGEGRTKMKPLKYQKGDAVAYALLAAYLAGVIIIKIVTNSIL